MHEEYVAALNYIAMLSESERVRFVEMVNVRGLRGEIQSTGRSFSRVPSPITGD